MNTNLAYRNGFLCVLADDGIHQKCWFPVIKAGHAEVHALLGRPVTQLDQEDGTYVDEEGTMFQLLDKGETKPIEVERLPGTEKTELEVLLDASLNGREADGKNGGAKRLLKKNRGSSRKQRAFQMAIAKSEARPSEAPPGVEASASTSNIATPEAPVHLNLRQKLAEVRRRGW